ncbi:MAG: PAS domain S-box protein [Nitrospirales bacterium]|nr:PAS domain S-box protein [Nitrospirales bacterium]
MSQKYFEQKHYFDAFIKAAQYLAMLSPDADLWLELGRVMTKFFGADIVTFGEIREGREVLIHHCTSPDMVGCERIFTGASKTVLQVLNTGFLASEVVSLPEPYSMAFLPITRENEPIAVMIVAHRTTEPIPRDVLNVYLAVAGLAKTTLARLASVKACQMASAYNRSLIEASLDPVVTISAEGKISDVNRATERVTGYPRKELIGTDFSSYFTEPERAREGYRRMFRAGLVKDYPLEIRRRDGHITPVLYNASLFKDEEGHVLGIFAAARDITERKKMEERLRKYMASLERSNKELEQFAYVASHDLQEPLRRIASFTELLAQRYSGQLDEKADIYIRFIVSGAMRMSTLINDLLTYSRVTTQGKAFSPTDMTEVVARVMKELSLVIAESGASITVDMMPTVMADGTQMGQAFQNLIINAIKFRGDAPPVIHVSAIPIPEILKERRNIPPDVQRHLREVGKGWVFSLRDNGIGIEPQYCDRIFEVFQRLHTEAEYPGTGIGLAICKKLVEIRSTEGYSTVRPYA